MLTSLTSPEKKSSNLPSWARRLTQTLSVALLGFNQQENLGCKHCTPEKARLKVENIIQASVDVESLVDDPKKLIPDLTTFYLESAIRAQKIQWQSYSENGIGGYSEGMAQNAKNFYRMMQKAAETGQAIEGEPIDPRRAYYESLIIETIESVIVNPESLGLKPGDFLIYVSPSGTKAQGYFGRDVSQAGVFHLVYIYKIKQPGEVEYWQIASKLDDSSLKKSIDQLIQLTQAEKIDLIPTNSNPTLFQGKMAYMQHLAPMLVIQSDRETKKPLPEIVLELFGEKKTDPLLQQADLAIKQARQVALVIAEIYQQWTQDNKLSEALNTNISLELMLLKLISVGYEHLAIWAENLRDDQPNQIAIDKETIMTAALARIKTTLGLKQTKTETQADKGLSLQLPGIINRVNSVTQCVVLSPASMINQVNRIGIAGGKNFNILNPIQLADQFSQKELNLIQELAQKGYVLVDFTDQGATQIFMVPADYLEGKGVWFDPKSGKVMGPCDIPLDDPREKLAVMISGDTKSSNAKDWFKQQKETLIGAIGDTSKRQRLEKLLTRIEYAVFKDTMSFNDAIVDDPVKNNLQARVIYQRLKQLIGNVRPHQLPKIIDELLGDETLIQALSRLETQLGINVTGDADVGWLGSNQTPVPTGSIPITAASGIIWQ